MPTEALAYAKHSTPSPAAGFRRLVEELTEEHVELWRETGSAPPVLGPRTGLLRRFRNYRRARRLIDSVAAEVERYPEEHGQRQAWRQRVRKRIQRFGEERLGWPAGYRDLLFADEFFDSTVAFVRQAREFDPQVPAEDLGQALRNVWIMNSLQMLLELPVETTPAIFAYSMLYPYTDNLLDDETVAPADKRRFNARLGRRLEGEPVTGGSRHETQVFALIGKIEEQFDRDRSPEVFESLLAIHRAQIQSLTQQDGERTPAELLRISVEKGGTSVLADGYLTAGRLRRSEAAFCFGYGVFLQLMDDLQDVEVDRRAGHRTLFSTSPSDRSIDRLTSRLHRYMERVLERSNRFSDPRYASLLDLIRRNCTFLLMGAVASTPHLLTRTLRRRLTRRWPFSLAGMRKLQRRLRRRAEEARGSRSLTDLVDA